MPLPTLGVEEELLLVDGRTGALRQDSDRVLDRARVLLAEGVEHELRHGVVETGSAPCAALEDVRREVRRGRDAAAAAAGEAHLLEAEADEEARRGDRRRDDDGLAGAR